MDSQNGSTVADHWRSNDNVKRNENKNAIYETPKRTHTGKNSQLDRDTEISPHTSVQSKHRFSVVPWEAEDLGSGNRSLNNGNPSARSSPAVQGSQSNDSYTQYNRQNRPTYVPSSVFNTSFLADDDIGPVSPGFRLPYNGTPAPDTGRRSSLASIATISSAGSRTDHHASAAPKPYKKKKLAGFFGDEYEDEHRPQRQDSEGSIAASNIDPTDTTSVRSRPLPNADDASLTSRHESISNQRPSSPTPGAPKGPKPSSEITPWDFQETTDVPQPPESLPPSGTATPNNRFKAHRLHLPAHKLHKSQDEHRAPAAREREPSDPPVRASVSSSSTVKQTRSTSPTPSMGSSQSRDTNSINKTPNPHSGGKKSLFARVKGRIDHSSTDRPAKHHNESSTSLSSQGGVPGPPTPNEFLKNSKSRKGTLASVTDLRPFAHGDKGSTKDKHRLHFKGKKPTQDGSSRGKERNPAKSNGRSNVASLWHLDTDMGNMEGIIDAQHLRQPSVMMTPPAAKFDSQADSFPWESNQQLPAPNDPAAAGTWDAPDSWAVKRIPGENEEEPPPETNEKDHGPIYFMRIFRADSTFAVVSAGINTTSAEIMHTMAKKTLLQDEIDTYQIVMRQRGLSRQLGGSERPLQIQAQLLQMAGYQQNDNLSELGRQDHGYLCRFTFLPSKMTGYSSLEKDPGFNKLQKFNYIDLAGRNLITIPIALYQRASEIITLNLSQNLSLDVPKDFMQSCSNLREVKYTSNEATRLPSSFAMAQKLNMVDFSNNRLESLDGSDLNRITGLISLKLSNNRLERLPPHIGSFHALRSLNLSSNSLTEFPDFLGNLTSLIDLDVSFNSMPSLPSIGKLTNLQQLFATNNKLSGSFPDNFRDLVNLSSLDVRFNTLDNIDVVSELPKLEHLMVGHNAISAFEGSFPRLKLLFIDHNPVTRFDLVTPVPSLSVLNIASAKLAQLPDDLYTKLSGLTKLVLNKNHLVSLSSNIGRMAKLEHLSIARNILSSLPSEIGLLQNLRYLDVRENNLNQLPSEIWYARRLETLNVASNVLAEFPNPGNPPREIIVETPQPTTPSGSSPDFDELGKLEGFQLRRPSYVGGGLPSSAASSPGQTTGPRKGSTVSGISSSRLPSIAARGGSQDSSINTSRKDSSLSGKLSQTFASSLRTLILADNRLTDDVFDELILLPELRQLNLSYNELYDMPPRTVKRWPNLTELYLSGNDLTTLPAEDLEDGSSLRILHLNSNKFQVLPAEIGKIQKLQTLDVASNSLKYNVTNWPYDWNWNYNPQLRYLNLSGNKRLEIRPNPQSIIGRGEKRDLTDFSTLTNLRILGLMDVTLTIPSVPDETPDRRVRTAGSIIGTSVPYGMADTLGRSEHLSTLDMVIPNFRTQEETVFGMFDGQALSSGGSRVARYLHEKFRYYLTDELDKAKPKETPLDALRRAYLSLNKDLATAATHAMEANEPPSAPGTSLAHRGSISAGPELAEDDITSGAVATVCYLHGVDLYVSNVGDAQAVLISSEGSHRVITRKHDPAETEERARIRAAGGFVSRQGKLNDVLEVSRAFGYTQHMPVVTAAPHLSHITLKDTDEMILLASRELWDYLTPDFAVDIARSERGDLMRAAQKLRDLAIAFGATSKIMVMMIGVSDLRKRERARFRTHSMSMGPTGLADDYFTSARRGKRGRDTVGDSKLARLDQEVDAPTGDVSLVFTDIKNSTMLWETFPIAMRAAIKMHNEVMRRHLRIIGGYEVKTEGDSFMVAFPTVTSALLWCFTIQSQLLELEWPQEILNSTHCQELLDDDGVLIFRGLSVRMGIHWGRPVCETDPITKRMDYFGPMVNRAARIESVADGGQITVSSDFIAEIQRLLEMHIETDSGGSVGSDEQQSDDLISHVIRRELRSLSSLGFEVKELGLKHLKGLENPENIYLMYPHSLASRLTMRQTEIARRPQLTSPVDVVDSRAPGSSIDIDISEVWLLYNLGARLELLCSRLETSLPRDEQPLSALQLRNQFSAAALDLTDVFLLRWVNQLITRIETATTTLAIRNAVTPFRRGTMGAEHAGPIKDVLGDVFAQLAELRQLKAEMGR